MRKFLGTAVALALLAAPWVAYAMEKVGIIDQIDAATSTLTLQDGSQFSVADGVKLDQLQPGAQVVVVYDEKDGKMIATEVKPSS